MSVTRYDFIDQAGRFFKVVIDGSYVLYSDYEKLHDFKVAVQKERDEFKKQRDELLDAAKNVVDLTGGFFGADNGQIREILETAIKSAEEKL